MLSLILSILICVILYYLKHKFIYLLMIIFIIYLLIFNKKKIWKTSKILVDLIQYHPL